jgi:uncharacterized DUF497 family protein
VEQFFIWNRYNLNHIDKHNVSYQEAKFVVQHAAGKYPKRIGDRKYLVRGRTRERRAIQVVYLVLGEEEVDVELLDLVDRVSFEQGNEAVYVIHARDLSAKEKRRI